MAKSRKASVNRRGFLKGAAAGAAAGATALVSGLPISEASQAPPAGTTAAQGDRGQSSGAPGPTAEQIARDAGNVRPPATVRAVNRAGSDLMVQVLKDMGVEYAAANPGSSFEGFQESCINYGGEKRNTMPEWITALHEESSVTMGHGYAKATGKPMVAVLHGTIGIQHAAMSIYQAYHGRVPIVMIAGRDIPFIAQHSAADMGGIVRSFTKWDALPKTLPESLTALQEAYRQAITPPMGPTLVVLDIELQKEEAGNLAVPKYTPPVFPTVDATRVREIATGLVNAQNPRIAVGRLRTPEGVGLSVQLAELVGASTSTSATGGPMSFPQRHPLQGPGADTNYDYTLGLETAGAQAAIIGPALATITAERDIAKIGFNGIQGAGGGGGGGRGGRGGGGGSTTTADAEASLPALIEEVKRQLTTDKRRLVTERTAKHAAANQAARVEAIKAAAESKRPGWDGSPVSTARIYAELWPLIMNEDWCLSSPSSFSGGHHAQLWDHNKPWSYLGGQDAGGMGYGAPASVGAALAAKSRNRIVINIQTDGDLNYAPGILWTAAHHKLPMLTIMHNNRAWHQELMFVEYMTGVRGRGTDRGYIGNALRDPDIDYCKMAECYGMKSEPRPISDPKLLAAAFKRGVDSVKKGEPYMIDVITQPR